MKKCPACAEMVQDEAIKCRFCGEEFTKRRKSMNCFTGCLVSFFISIAVMIILGTAAVVFFNVFLRKMLADLNVPLDSLRDIPSAIGGFIAQIRDFFSVMQVR